MRKSFTIAAIFTLLIAAAWFLSDSLYFSPYDAQKFGISFTQLSGVLAIALMAFSTLLAVRPIWMENWFMGLDKMYRLHKWMAIVAMVIGVAHWLTAQSPNGHRGPPGAAAADTAAATLQSLLRSLEGPAREVAQPALWILLALVAIALIKKIPYHIFALTHRLVPLVFLVLVFHSVVWMRSSYWAQPIGILMAPIYVIGTVAALIALFRLIGAGRKVEGTVTSKRHFADVRTLLVEMDMDKAWKGHKPGQFVFVRGRRMWGAHPFTIASAWTGKSQRISFIVKELGDATKDLASRLPIGAKLIVEGPYGRFNFDDNKSRQIWISGGIGITPFVARMEQLIEKPEGRPIDLFHSNPIQATDAHDLLRRDTKRSGVNLHLMITPVHGRLTGEKIRKEVPDWKSASFWFCGPSRFAAVLKLDLMRHGLKSQDFHHELFEMR